MIKFMNMEIKGFCSIQDLSITLGTEGIHLVKGNNGSGKSSFLNAISWCLYGKTLKNIKVGDKIFVLFDNTILAEPSEIKVLTVDKKGRKFIYSGHYKFNIEYGNNVSNITVSNLTAFATFEEAEEKAKTSRYGLKKEIK